LLLGRRLGQLSSAFVRLGIIAAIAILPAYFFVQFLDWPRGLRLQLGRHEFEPPHYFLNGEVSSHGWWWYFPEVIALKTPAGTLILAIFSLGVGIVGRQFTRRDVAFLLVPAAVFFLGMVAARINIGLRVILPAYPLLWLLAARVATMSHWVVPRKAAWCAVGGAVILPPLVDGDLLGQRSLSYVNGVVAGRAEAHRYLGDSNLDWGQGLTFLSARLREDGYPVIYLSYAGTARPEAHGVRYERLPGWGEFREPPDDRVDPSGRVLVAVSVTNLQGTYLRDPTAYLWLLEREPISRLDGSIWLWDVTGDAAAMQRLRTLSQRP
jgi:hypothetical protein